MVRRLGSQQVAQKSQGIQTLLEAEKEASKIVEKARTCTCGDLPDRTQKLKEAQTEAEKDLAALKQTNDKAIQQFQAKVGGASDAVLRRTVV